MEGEHLLETSAQTASYNIVLQIFFRVQTFVLNGFILRYISKEILGIINVRLHLLYSSVLFLSKEAFRNTALSNTREHDWPQLINLLWLVVPASILCSLGLGYVWIYFLELPPADEEVDYIRAVLIVCLCCVLEMAAEPLYIVARIHVFNKLRVVLESLSVSVKCLALALTVYFQPDQAIYGYAFGQILCSTVWVVGIYGYFFQYFQSKNVKTEAKTEFTFNSISHFLPRYLSNKELFRRDQLALTWSFFKQGFLKQLLTEGERYVMTLLGILTFAEQGIYDVVNNLGSMAARFILRPIEDASYQFFAGLVKRDQVLNKQNKREIRLVSQVLKNLLRFMVLLGLLAISFGFAYSRLLLHLYGGSLLSSGSGPVLLRWHCVYILFLAVNGITECFAFATMSKRDVEIYNYVMVGFSVVFIFLSWYFTTLLGSQGFILANCANMLARIVYSTRFIYRNFRDEKRGTNPLNGLIPDAVVSGAILTSFVLTLFSQSVYGDVNSWLNVLCHVSVGATCLLLVAAVTFFREKELVQFSRDLLWHKKID